MSPRIARCVVAGLPHHVVQRGNRRQSIFADDADRVVYARILGENTLKRRLKLWAYVLMPNHVHLICVPGLDTDLADVFRMAHGAYALYFNKRHGHVGHLFQARFYSAILDEKHLYNAVRYVERNPVRAGMTATAESYPWSSAAAHCGLRLDNLLNSGLPVLTNVLNWSAWLREPDEQDYLDLIRATTVAGRPTGDEKFVARLEAQTGRQLRPQRPGPRHARKSGTVTSIPELPELGN